MGLDREALKAIIEAKWAGDEALAWQIYQHWLPLMVFEQQCAPRLQHPQLFARDYAGPCRPWTFRLS